MQLLSPGCLKLSKYNTFNILFQEVQAEVHANKKIKILISFDCKTILFNLKRYLHKIRSRGQNLGTTLIVQTLFWVGKFKSQGIEIIIVCN